MKTAKYLVLCTLGWLATGTGEADEIREIEMRRLFDPNPSELAAEANGRIYIYDGLTSEDVERAIDEEFARVESMMFIRTKTPKKTPTPRDPAVEYEYQSDDGC